MNNDWALLETERFMEPCAFQAGSLDGGVGETTVGEVRVFVVRSLSWTEVLWFRVVELLFLTEEFWFLMKVFRFLNRAWRKGLLVLFWS